MDGLRETETQTVRPARRLFKRRAISTLHTCAEPRSSENFRRSARIGPELARAPPTVTRSDEERRGRTETRIRVVGISRKFCAAAWGKAREEKKSR